MKKQTKIIILLILFSFLIRFAFISDCLFHHDTIQLAKAVNKTIITRTLQPTVSNRYGLVLINVLSYLVIPFSLDFTLNLTAIIFASLSIGFVYLFVKNLTNNEGISTITALLFSLTPIFLTVTTYAKSHGISFFFSMAALYYFTRYLEPDNAIDEIIFIFLFIFSSLVRATNIFYAIPMFLIVILKKEKLNKLIPVIFSVLSILALNFRVLFYEATSQSSLNFFLILEQIVNLLTTITPLGILLISISILKEKKQMVIFLMVWFLALFIPVSIISTTSARFLIPSLLPIFILISMSLDKIININKSVGIILTILIISFMLAISIPIINFRHNYCGPKEFSLFVNKNTEEDSLIVSEDDSVFFEYYGKRKAISFNEINQYNKTIYITKQILDRHNSTYDLEFIGGKLNENYHHSELKLNIYTDYLFRILVKDT